MSLPFLKIEFPRTAGDFILDFSDYNFLNLVVCFLSAIYHVLSRLFHLRIRSVIVRHFFTTPPNSSDDILSDFLSLMSIAK